MWASVAGRTAALIGLALVVGAGGATAQASRRPSEPGFRTRYPHIPYVQGDACALPFADGEFEVVFSNAVLEHVGGRERQRQFVSEALRVGRRVFVTTPNRLFPVEVHTRLPFAHWLPERAAHRVYEALGRGFAKDVHLLSPHGLRALFPGRVRIVNLGLTLVAIVD